METIFLNVRFNLDELNRLLQRGNAVGIKFQRDDVKLGKLTLKASPVFRIDEREKFEPIFGEPLSSKNPDFQYYDPEVGLDYVLFFPQQFQMLKAFDGTDHVLLSGALINYGDEGAVEGSFFTLKAEPYLSGPIKKGIEEIAADEKDKKSRKILLKQLEHYKERLEELTFKDPSKDLVRRELKSAANRTRDRGNQEEEFLEDPESGMNPLMTDAGIASSQIGQPCPPLWN